MLMKKQGVWKVGKAGSRDLQVARKLLSGSKLPIDGLHQAEFWSVRDGMGAVIGVAGLETWGKQGLVRSVVVEERYRRSGIGKALVERVLQEASGKGLVELYLITETAPRFFETFGFVSIERQEVKGRVLDSVEFREACPQTAPVMRLCLS